MSAYETHDATEVAEVDQSEAVEPESLSPSGQRAMQGDDSYTAQVEQASESGDAPQMSEGADALDPEVWQTIDAGERLQALQDLENALANDQGRPAVGVVAEPMGAGTYGYYDGNVIRINEASLESDDVVEAVDTIAHEGRHAYQHYAIETPGFHPDEDEVEVWRDNFQNYMSAEEYGQELYENQPVERDARDYAAGVCQSLYG